MTIDESVKGIRAIAELAVATGLHHAGEALKNVTRSRHSQSVGDSRLTKSIDFLVTGPSVESSYVGKLAGNLVKTDSETDNSRDKLPVPTQPLSLVFGAGAPFSGYVERGTAGPYGGGPGNATPEDGTFREKITIWAANQGLDAEAAGRIADSIWAKGTDAHPFMPSEREMQDIILSSIASANKMVFATKRLPDLVFKVGKK